MFKKNKSQAGVPPRGNTNSGLANANNDRQEVNTIIGGTTRLEGDIHFTGILKIDGKVDGNLVAESDDAVLILNEDGQIDGEVRVPSMIVNGKINGNVYATDKIDLYPKAQIIGDVHYNLLEMEVGAEVNGRMLRQESSTKAPASKSSNNDLSLESVDNLEPNALSQKSE